MEHSKVEPFKMDEMDHGTTESVEPNLYLCNENDLLVSIFLTNKKSNISISTENNKSLWKCKSLKTISGHSRNKNWPTIGSRIVLMWLIDSRVISPGEIIQFCGEEDNVVKEGLITIDGIVCGCCRVLFTLSNFKTHVGFDCKSLCVNLVMKSGKPLALCQLEVWSAEYKARKVTVEAEEVQKGDDHFGICGLPGKFVNSYGVIIA